MREILFRGKTEEGDWYIGSLCKYTFERPISTIVFYKIQEFNQGFADEDDFEPTYISGFDEEVIPETVGQYTGLTDKNGKKIFEGDIVEYTEFYKFSDDEDLESAEERTETIAVVKFVNGRFTPLPTRRNCEDYWYSYAEDNFKVIGNIHDNPELLKGGVKE